MPFLIDEGPGEGAVDQVGHSFGDNLFGAIEASQENAGRCSDRIGDNCPFTQFQLECGQDQPLRHLKQIDTQRNELLRRQATVAFVHSLGQGIGDTGADPDHRRLSRFRASWRWRRRS